MRRRLIAVGALGALVLIAVAGCGSRGVDSVSAKGPITVGSKIDTEGGVLGHIIIAVLEDAGYDVVDKTKTGTTDVVRKALTSGEVDIYPEYTGTALTQFFPDAKIAGGVSNDGQASFDTVKELDAANGIVWLERAPANNTWAIAIPGALADANNIESLADWADYINAGNPVKLVGSQEFVDRDDALPAFETAYGFSLKADQLIILSGGDTAQTEAAAAQGTNGANAAMAYGTDGSLAALGLVVLSDPEGVQPVYEPAPSIRKAVLDKYPGIVALLDPVFKGLTLETLQELNGKVSVDGQDPKAVATEYLKSKGLIR
jgi:osmoprotectant transport system substrate-binding protein